MADTTLDQANATVLAAGKQAAKDYAAAVAAFANAINTCAADLGTNPPTSAAQGAVSSAQQTAAMLTMGIANLMSLYGMNPDGTDITPPAAPAPTA